MPYYVSEPSSLNNKRSSLWQKKPKKEEDVEPETKEQVSETQKAPMLSVLAQYTKDQSFENPNAPDSLRSGLSAPEIQINIEIGRQMLEGDNIEVTLMLKAEAKRGDKMHLSQSLNMLDSLLLQASLLKKFSP